MTSSKRHALTACWNRWLLQDAPVHKRLQNLVSTTAFVRTTVPEHVRSDSFRQQVVNVWGIFLI